jgi:hypothetical protein
MQEILLQLMCPLIFANREYIAGFQVLTITDNDAKWYNESAFQLMYRQ